MCSGLGWAEMMTAPKPFICVCKKEFQKEIGLRVHWGHYHTNLAPGILETCIQTTLKKRRRAVVAKEKKTTRS